ncbi:MAG: hypothetical protein OHK0012_15960 [Synechococcales cyanobacterium]
MAPVLPVPSSVLIIIFNHDRPPRDWGRFSRQQACVMLALSHDCHRPEALLLNPWCLHPA